VSAGLSACLLWLAVAPGAGRADPSDVFYRALLGAPDVVEFRVLLGSPGRFVGRAVQTRAVLVETGPDAYAVAEGVRRARLRLEPEAAAVAMADEGRLVDVVGLFYGEDLGGADNAYAIRAWSVHPVGGADGADGEVSSDALPLPLEELVYGAGRYDGRLVRVRGAYRGSNLHNDLPVTTRDGPHDWVLKDGDFAVWVTGREARGESWDLTGRTRGETDTPLEVVGVPRFRDGVVRLAARAIDIADTSGVAVTTRALGLSDVGHDPLERPRVTFAYPIEGDPLDSEGHMIVQFSTSMDSARFASGVRVRYESAGAVVDAPPMRLDYRDRYRALVITPQTPPPAGTEVVVDLLDTVIDVEGRALVPSRRGPGEEPPCPGVVDQVRFRSRR